MTTAEKLAMKPRKSGGDEDAGAGRDRALSNRIRGSRLPAPAKVARKILEGVFNCEVPPQKIGLPANEVRWGYGTSWGALYGLLPGTARVSPVPPG